MINYTARLLCSEGSFFPLEVVVTQNLYSMIGKKREGFEEKLSPGALGQKAWKEFCETSIHKFTQKPVSFFLGPAMQPSNGEAVFHWQIQHHHLEGHERKWDTVKQSELEVCY